MLSRSPTYCIFPDVKAAVGDWGEDGDDAEDGQLGEEALRGDLGAAEGEPDLGSAFHSRAAQLDTVWLLDHN